MGSRVDISTYNDTAFDTIFYLAIISGYQNSKNMKYPTTRFVFDRKKVATKTHKGLVQIEV